MTENYIRKHFNEITDWEEASKYGDFSYAFMREFADYLDFNTIIQYRDFKLDFLREFRDKINSKLFGSCFNLKIIEEYVEYFDEWEWEAISQYAHLTKKFCKKYADRLKWYSVITHQKGIDEKFRLANLWRCNKIEQEALREQFKFIERYFTMHPIYVEDFKTSNANKFYN